jgi:anthranilate synthase/indole-3-glycerol phosphate synthase/phosphoribosylanthranilate isomerase
MGLECIVDVLGGEIAYAGEILHGKTSLVTHDGRGCFADIPQLIPSTRYHSLAARLKTLPDALVVTATTQESGVIMGVRHKEFTIEAVQYHPESVMSEGGRELLKNFLKLEGGKWGGKNEWCGVIPHDAPNGTHPIAPLPAPSALPTILDRIHQQRITDIETSSALPSSTPAILSTALRLHAAPPITPLLARIRQTLPAHPAVMAEIKRASPSKGDISIHTSAPDQALKYALAGASVISVLTEPKWFKGALSDLLSVRMALDALPNRPALLRKDFIISTYQIDEARLHGADTVLLIVAMLTPAQLQLLYTYSVSLGMEPLVEVNNADELAAALDLGSKVIGVNNRNLHDFNVDMGTTSRLADVLRERGREDVVLCALSGITGRADVERYVEQGVKAVLVGESLMRAEDPKAFMHEMLGLSSATVTPPQQQQAPLVKICGVQRFEDAKVAVEAGADFIGLIFAKSKRQIELPVARQIASFIASRRAAENTGEETLDDLLRTATESSDPLAPKPWFTTHAAHLSARSKPLLVGVFQNQPLAFIQSCISRVPLDAVQLHGDEPVEWARQLAVPVIKAFRVSPSTGEIQGAAGAAVDRAGCNHLVLLDAAGKSGSAGGGEGISFDWSVARSIVNFGEIGTAPGTFRLPVILAGGLHPANVAEAVRAVRPWCVDVSSGVEREDGQGKDAGKVEEFIRNAKAA